MILLKHIINEISNSDLNFALDQIRRDNFKFLGSGDNGRVYEINNTDLVFKITSEPAEFDIAKQITGKSSVFTTFIPVYYHDNKNMYIMNNASELTASLRMSINQFIDAFKSYAREVGGEVSIFEFLHVCDRSLFSSVVLNFFDAVQSDINKLNIPDIALELDVNVDNIMLWNGSLVMVDW